jgi:divalent metal cation (Fe/Co/Zn/Cd) transporter
VNAFALTNILDQVGVLVVYLGPILGAAIGITLALRIVRTLISLFRSAGKRSDTPTSST